jgi:D-alanyl-D-alanine carboxypeptidase (penicillin-binding protein 5/6)
MRKILLIVLLTILSFDVLKADNLSGIDIKSESGIIMEASTGKILFDKNMDEQKSPASMTKIMTMLLTVEAIESGKISLEDEVNISANASKMGGSQVYLEENSTATVEMLLKSIAIGSANDASVAVAEKIGGTESNFVNMMNKRAKELGAVNTTFKNPHGLDEEGHLTTAHDLALIARELIKHEEILKLTSTYETTITHKNGKSLWLVNTNKLIKFYNGLDGLKTGFTDNAGYCLTGTMLRNDMRLITVTMKAPTKEDRNTDTINLMEYAYSMYYKSTLIKKDKKIGDMFIDNAKKRKVSYYLKEDASVILDKDVRNIKYNYSVKLNNVKAPLKKNDVVGTLTLHLNNQDINYNLIVKENIKKSNYFVRLSNYLKDIINGNLNVLP